MSALRDVLHHLAGVDKRLLAIALTFHLGNHLLRSVAWRGVLAAAYSDRDVPFIRVAAAYAAGVALNAVAPARGGDAAKVLLVRASLPGSSVATIGATMSVLMAFDIVAATLLTIAIGVFGTVPISAPSPPGWEVVAGVAIAAVAVGVALHRVRHVLGRLVEDIKRGGAILRTPRRYGLTVALPQAGAWCCRVAVVVCLLAAFGLPASVPLAAVVMVLTGASTLVPLTPGGAGTQQVVLALALSNTASAAAVVSFSLGMQASVTIVNALLGVVAAMVLVRSSHPVAAVRSLRRLIERPAAGRPTEKPGPPRPAAS